MSRKTKQHVSYVLPIPGNTSAGHRLGVNGLAVDPSKSILYTGGRDGLICAWGLQDAEAKGSFSSSTTAEKPVAIARTTHRQHVQAHSNWCTSLALMQDGAALVSGSYDLSVKVWRPHSDPSSKPQIIGRHSDYVKRLASPSQASTWIASGGLDRKVCLWDLHGAGQRLQIKVFDQDSEKEEKCPVYALTASETVVAAGGLESVVKLWDTRSGRRINRLVGHTDYIRDLLISCDGETVLSAAADKTIKVWSLSMGRCIYSMNMHRDPVFSLFSNDEHLSSFYSGDRSGLIVKTQANSIHDLDNAISVGVAQEEQGVNSIVAAGGHVWAATARSSVNRWSDADLRAGVTFPDSLTSFRFSQSSGSRIRMSASSFAGNVSPSPVPAAERIPPSCVLRLSNTATFPPLFRDRNRSSVYNANSVRRPSVNPDGDLGVFKALRDRPSEAIEGTSGLVKHWMLNDKRRVLTQDSLGEVSLWDLIRCSRIESYGKRDGDEVFERVNTIDQVANWCSVDIFTGLLRCRLEESRCFDAEVYADETEEANGVNFREDHRIVLGKWVLRYLFAQVVDEEIRRDEDCRQQLLQARKNTAFPGTSSRPSYIQIPASTSRTFNEPASASAMTPKAKTPGRPVATPSFAISVAHPSLAAASSPISANVPLIASPTDTTSQGLGGSRPTSSDRAPDYFSSRPPVRSSQDQREERTPASQDNYLPTSPSESDATASQKSGGSSFSKRLKASFSARKVAKTTSLETPKAAIQEEERSGDEASSKSSQAGDKTYEDSFKGYLEKLRAEYLTLSKAGQAVPTLLAPSLPSDTPMITIPSNTVVVVQEDRPESGGVVDLFEGEIGALAQHVDTIEHVAPVWLAEALLRNTLAKKEPLKMTFVLEAKDNSVPSLVQPTGTDRLNANRMLRVRKVLAYVAEKIEPQAYVAETIDMKPEEYLELWCGGQMMPPTATLSQMRQHYWRSPGDLTLQYRSNGKRQLPNRPPSPPAQQPAA